MIAEFDPFMPVSSRCQNEKTRHKAGFLVMSEWVGTLSDIKFGSTTWTRTRDPMINSHLLYQLSYRGMRRMLLIKKKKSSVLRNFPQIVPLLA